MCGCVCVCVYAAFTAVDFSLCISNRLQKWQGGGAQKQDSMLHLVLLRSESVVLSCYSDFGLPAMQPIPILLV